MKYDSIFYGGLPNRALATLQIGPHKFKFPTNSFLPSFLPPFPFSHSFKSATFNKMDLKSAQMGRAGNAHALTGAVRERVLRVGGICASIILASKYGPVLEYSAYCIVSYRIAPYRIARCMFLVI